MITYTHTPLFQTQAQTIAIPVNIIGIMGAGVALEAKQRFPEILSLYAKLCRDHVLTVDAPQCVIANGQQLLLIATKKAYHFPSRIEYIDSGLSYLSQNYEEMGITSLSLPQLGCGRGNLEWEDVKLVMVKHLSDLPIPIYIHIF